jgi:RNA-binding protein
MRADKNKNLMQELRPTVWIGKQGCSDTIIQEIADQLEKRDVVKIKWLQNIEIDPAEVAARAGALLVAVRGRTLVLARRRKR